MDGSFPDEDARVLVVTFQVVFDCGDQLRNAIKTAAADSLVGNLAKPALDEVQPRTRRRNEVKVESGMSSNPGFDPWVFVGCVVVHDQMQIEMRWRLDIDLVEETNELLVSLTCHAVADHFAIEHAQCGEQRGACSRGSWFHNVPFSSAVLAEYDPRPEFGFSRRRTRPEPCRED